MCCQASSLCSGAAVSGETTTAGAPADVAAVIEALLAGRWLLLLGVADMLEANVLVVNALLLLMQVVLCCCR